MSELLKSIAEEYWIKKLQGKTLLSLPERISLNPTFSTAKPDPHIFPFSAALSHKLMEVSRVKDNGLYLILISALNVLLHKYTGSQKILVATPGIPMGTKTGEAQGLLFFQSIIQEDTTPKILLKEGIEELNAILENKDFTFEVIQKRFPSDHEQATLHQIGFSYEAVNAKDRNRNLDALHLLFKVSKTEDSFSLSIQSTLSTYHEEAILQFGHHYLWILHLFLNQADLPIRAMKLLTPEEETRLIAQAGATRKDIPHQTLVELFESQVQIFPDAPCLMYQDEVLTYREVNQAANRLAHYFKAQYHIKPNEVVALALHRSEKTVIGILAILKAGGSFLPIDPSYPDDRKQFLLEDAAVKLLLIESYEMFEVTSYYQGELFAIDVPLEDTAEVIENPPLVNTPDDLAYIIYTSGTTGVPKGVEIQHKSFVNYILWANRFYFNEQGNRTFPLFTSISFDLTLTSLFLPLVSGGRLVILEEKPIDELLAQIFDGSSDIRAVKLTPSHINVLGEMPLTSTAIQTVIAGGEALHPKHIQILKSLNPSISIYNEYGPTEATVGCTVKKITKSDDPITLGKAIDNAAVYILDEEKNLLPPGIPGEIFIGGIGVTKGYRNQESLTTRKIFQDPFQPDHQRMYQTGDLGKWLTNGEIEYIGRKDRQVKIKGYRIECGEIEKNLTDHPAIQEAVVLASEGNDFLRAFYLAQEPLDTQELRQFLGKKVPEYMVPQEIGRLLTFPLTQNGKIDYEALSKIQVGVKGMATYVPPSHELEKHLISLFQDILNLDSIGIDDNFFTLGGDSIKGIRLANKIQETLGELIHITLIFEAPTVRQLAAKLEQYHQEKNKEITAADVEAFQRIIPSPPPFSIGNRKNKPAAFVLSPPRSGSTLLRVILAGHPALFAPPELELLGFNDLQDRKKALSGTYSLFLEGTIRAMMQLKNCPITEALRMMEQMEEENLSVKEFFGQLQDWAQNQLLVDKSPNYAFDKETLARMEHYFENPKYIHLLRNPYGMIHSFEKAKMDQIFRYPHTYSLRELAELVWVVSHQNIVEHLSQVPEKRKHVVRFEDLVQHPESTVRELCEFLEVPFQPEMLCVYDHPHEKMVDGIYDDSKMIGDVKFLQHQTIAPGVADQWKKEYTTPFLSPLTQSLSAQLGYETLEKETEKSAFTIQPVPVQAYYEVTHAQRRLWIISQFEEGKNAHNIPAAYILEGLDKKAFEQTFKTIVQRHEILRTRFMSVDGQPKQHIDAFGPGAFQVAYEDVSQEPNWKEIAEKLSYEASRKPFDLAHDTLIRIKLVQLPDDKHLLLLTLHHIVADGWSMQVLLNEFKVLYHAYRNGWENPLPPLRVQYKDYAAWQNEQLDGTHAREHQNYWWGQLEGEIPVLNLPTDFPRPAVRTFNGKRLQYQLKADIVRELNQFSARNGASLFMALVASVNALLYKYTGQTDIIIGSPIAGRDHESLENMMGLFLNNLPLRTRFSGEDKFKTLLANTKAIALGAFEHQVYPFDRLVDDLNLARDMSRSPLYDVAVVLQNMDVSDEPTEIIEGIRVEGFDTGFMVSLVDLRIEFIASGQGLTMNVDYNTDLFSDGRIQRLCIHFETLLHALLAHPETPLKALSCMPEEEIRKILTDFNSKMVDYPVKNTMAALFEAQVMNNPEAVAVVCQEERLTYQQLNEKANQLAHYLREQVGVHPDDRVALMMNKSEMTVIGILGTLKAGGVYLPIDPTLPRPRIDYMLKDAAAKALLTESNYLLDIDSFDGEVVALDIQLDTLDTAQHNPTRVNAPGDLAYIIYTSGSTGQPKGVIIAHESTINMSFDQIATFGVRAEDKVLQFASLSFDASISEIFMALFSGATLVIPPPQVIHHPAKMQSFIHENEVTIATFPPHYLRALDIAQLRSLKSIITAGEQAMAEDLARCSQHSLTFNAYGPTECAVCVSIYQVHPEDNAKSFLPIGRPIANMKVYILGEHEDALVPIGIDGEICVAGIGVARGYLNQETLTQEKFVPNPFDPDEKLYRTGDLGRWLPDGNLEFRGRKDKQVKVRGYRIELGEIENALLMHPAVQDAIVVTRKDQRQDVQLIAYCIMEPDQGEPMDAAKLRQSLMKQIPEYIIPQYFIALPEFPVNTSGKIDTKALPDPEKVALTTEGDYVAPRNERETILAEIWAKALGRKQVGVLDNFFNMGGDSIKAIQTVSRLHKAGYHTDVKDIFQYPVIEALANRVQKHVITADQSVIEGEVPLTPLQQQFFHRPKKHPHHYNQAVMLYARERLHKKALHKIFSKIQEHHDALRMTFEEKDGKIIQKNRNLDVAVSVEEFDLFSTDAVEVTPSQQLEMMAQEMQQSIDLQTGPLMKIGIFHLDDGDRLLIIIHHLVVDAVSWRILSEDIESLWQQYQENTEISREALSLPAKTDSFQTWTLKLSAYAQSQALRKEVQFWKNQDHADLRQIPKDFDQPNERKDLASLSISFTNQLTHLLLTQTNHAFNTEINDILLTALALGVYRTFGLAQIPVLLEGHGREPLFDEVDISRTVGWFTSVYPVLLNIEPSDDLERQIRTVKEYLRSIPKKGIGYGILKYLIPASLKGDISLAMQPQISFNYLGQFDTDLSGSFAMAEEGYGQTQAMDERRDCALEFSGVVADQTLTISVAYSQQQFLPETIKGLLHNYQNALEEIVQYCSEKSETAPTPSDFSYPALSMDTLDELLQHYDVADICPLSPMQEGMLFQSMYDKDSLAYFDQASYRIHGEFDIATVEKSLGDLVKRHDILRTAFVTRVSNQPLQVIMKERKLHFHYEDLRSLSSEEEKLSFSEDYKARDRSIPFDFENGHLLRVAVLQPNENEYEFIWSHHHILMDGWCIRILITEFLEIYDSYIKERPLQLLPVQPYKKYLQWLGQQDKEASRTYWKQYLAGYKKVAEVPKMKAINIRQQGDKNEHIMLHFDKTKTHQILQLAARYQLTINNVIQSIWGVLLSKYNHTQDVVFGTIVSGRPADIPGVESMVGLFINAIPVRVQYTPATRFHELAQQVQHQAILGEKHHYFPLAEIRTATQAAHIINHLLTFENYPVAEQIEGILEEQVHAIKEGKTEHFELSQVEVFDQNHYDFNILFGLSDQLILKLEYTDAYERTFIEGIVRHFTYLMDQVLAQPEITIEKLDIVTEKEKENLLTVSQTITAFPREKTITQLFEEQARLTPDMPALVFENSRYSYQALNEKSNQLAHHLIQTYEVQPDDTIALLLDRSDKVIISILAILKAGAGYVPIDPAYPQERIEYMLKDTNPKVLLTQSDYMFDLDYFSGALFAVDIQLNDLEEPTSNPIHRTQPDHLAYVMYTSGSTGLPKGVMVTHKGVVRLVKDTNYIQFTAGSRLIMTGALSFDATTFEIWGMLLNGGTLYVMSHEKMTDTRCLKSTMLEEEITMMWFTASWFNQLVDTDIEIFSRLQYLLVGGEKLSPLHINLVKDAYPALKIINGYGPTENTTFSICGSIKENYETSIPIGKPIANTTVYILDPQLQPVPLGIEGEIYLGGEGLARGYLNQPQLTAEKFIPNPFEINARLYRTGDLAKWLPDGQIEFIGRIDDQVKIRGFRVEPGEIANVIKKCKEVKDAFVFEMEDHQGSKYLSAALVPDEEQAFTLSKSLRLDQDHEEGATQWYPLPNGMLVAHKNKSETDFLYQEIFENHTYNKNGVQIKDGDVIVDVGGNIGMFALYASARYKATQVYSFEPVPPTFHYLHTNASLYPSNIRAFDFGLSDEEQTVKFSYYPYNTVMSGRYGEDQEIDKEILRGYFAKQSKIKREQISKQQVEAILDERMQVSYYDCKLRKLSNVIREEKIERIDLLKIDVEKSELDVLKGIEPEDWPKIKQVIIEVHDLNGQLKTIQDLLEAQGFYLYVEQENILEDTHLYNVYATKDEEAFHRKALPASHERDALADILVTPQQLIDLVQGHCKTKLPGYMQPQSYRVWPFFPLTPHGKIDVPKLKALAAAETGNQNNYLAPRNVVENQLVLIWQEVLGKEKIGVRDNFFEVGGHSLKATQVLSRIQKECNVPLELSSLFATPTIEALAEEILQSGFVSYEAIQPVAPQAYYEVSHAQKRLWVTNQFEEERVAYNMPGAMLLEGILHREAFEKAFDALIERHESLRTTFVVVDEQPMQKIHKVHEINCKIDFIDLQGEENQEALIHQMAYEEASKVFDLEKGPLLGAKLVQVAESRHYLFFTMHHIISDGWSLGVLLHDFLTIYDAYCHQKPNPLQPLKIHYKDYAHWHNRLLHKENIAAHRRYWQNRLEKPLPVLDFPTSYSRPSIKTTHGKSIKFVLEKSDYERLKTITHATNASSFMVLLTSLYALIYRYTHQHDIIIGTPVAGRENFDLEEQIGYFLNTLPLREQFQGSDAFQTLLEQVKQHTAQSMNYQAYPFDIMIEDLGLQRDRSRNLLFDIGFNLNHENELVLKEGHAFHHIKVSNLETHFGTVKTDLWFNANDTREGIWFSVEYNTDLFREIFIRELIDNYCYLLHVALSDLHITLDQLCNKVDRFQEKKTIVQKGEVEAKNLDNLLKLGNKFKK